MIQLCFTILAFSILTILAEERPRSALEWITVSEAKKLPNGFENKDLVRFRLLDPLLRDRMFCRAMIDGCTYPGEATWGGNGPDSSFFYCYIMTKEKVERFDVVIHLNGSTVQLLYNPNGAAQITWLPWDQGTGNVNFPTEVVKSDESQNCNFMLARYNDLHDLGFVDSQGYVYYVAYDSAGAKIWYWDDNEYDLLIERPAKGG